MTAAPYPAYLCAHASSRTMPDTASGPPVRRGKPNSKRPAPAPPLNPPKRQQTRQQAKPPERRSPPVPPAAIRTVTRRAFQRPARKWPQLANRHRHAVACRIISRARLRTSCPGASAAPKPARNAQVAQLVEQRTENPRVGGSIPPLGTIDSSY